MRRTGLALLASMVVVVSSACGGSTDADRDDVSGGDPASTPTTAEASDLATTTVPDAAPGVGERWTPSPGATFAWQLRGRVDAGRIDAEVVDVDGFDTPTATVDELHRRGAHVICYVSVGSFENWRPDAPSFPEEVLGAPLDGWEGERWLDVRRLDVLEPIMAARMDRCRDHGFDAVEADNVDGYLNESGFPLGAEDQLAFNRRMAAMAHERGLSFALKNDLPQIPDLLDDVDFSIVEQCAEFDECDRVAPFVQAGKAVFDVEYDACPAAVPTGVTMVLLPLELDGTSRRPC